ncbi:hypothetical protein WG66_007351 [Moniliophthora roreri]|nr:hypothetical protein WG66_007351 [Moniliophthora roreri]
MGFLAGSKVCSAYFAIRSGARPVVTTVTTFIRGRIEMLNAEDRSLSHIGSSSDTFGLDQLNDSSSLSPDNKVPYEATDRMSNFEREEASGKRGNARRSEVSHDSPPRFGSQYRAIFHRRQASFVDDYCRVH